MSPAGLQPNGVSWILCPPRRGTLHPGQGVAGVASGMDQYHPRLRAARVLVLCACPPRSRGPRYSHCGGLCRVLTRTVETLACGFTARKYPHHHLGGTLMAPGRGEGRTWLRVRHAVSLANHLRSCAPCPLSSHVHSWASVSPTANQDHFRSYRRQGL